MRRTSWPGSMIWAEWTTGFGTASRSETAPPSGEAIISTDISSEPVASRMSWRRVTVSSTGPVFIEACFRPM